MVTNVFLSGRLGKNCDEKTRYVEVDRVIPGAGGKFSTDQFLVRTMMGKESSFMKAPIGNWIIVKGRLETQQGQTIIVSEIDEILQAKPAK